MNVHPVADIFPAMSASEFDALKADIAEHGLREPVWTKGGAIIDGRHRWRACEELGTGCEAREYDGDDLVAFVVSLNLRRRHLDESQRAMVAANIATLPVGANQHRSIDLPTQTAAAALLNVSVPSVKRAAVVRDHGVPELVCAVTSGAVSVSTAADVATLAPEEQREVVARGEREILMAAKEIRARKADENRAARDQLRAESLAIDPPAGKYRVIVIDPPWQMEKIQRDVTPEQVGFEYPTMTEEEIRSFDVAAFADEDCHLFCWTTHKHLPEAIRHLEAWGFSYVLTMVWHKPGGFQPFGLPQYNCEFCLYARRGAPEFVDTKAFPVCFNAPRREHSRKPDEFYDVIKRVTPGPRIDVFSRENRDGFEHWGNEAGKFAA